MLDRERADFYRTLAQIQEQFSSRCVAVHLPIGAEHELTGIVEEARWVPRSELSNYQMPDGTRFIMGKVFPEQRRNER